MLTSKKQTVYAHVRDLSKEKEIRHDILVSIQWQHYDYLYSGFCPFWGPIIMTVAMDGSKG
jgi:hypothetical protein